jgi:hypothetical protein
MAHRQLVPERATIPQLLKRQILQLVFEAMGVS